MILQKKNYFNLRPAVIVTAGFIIGILLGGIDFNLYNHLAFALFLLTALSLGAVSTVCFVEKSKYYGVMFLLSAIALILGLIFIKVDLSRDYDSVGYGLFSGVVYEIKSENAIGDKYVYSLIVKGDFIDNKNVLCYVDIYFTERIFYGSNISFNANFSLYDKPYNNDVFYFAESLSNISVGELSGLIAILRNRLLITLQSHAGENYGLTYALLTGDTSYVLESVLLKYQKIGVAHLFAVSGLHVGLMYGILFFAVKLLKISGNNRFIAVSFILFCYVGFCGFSPSSMRAFIIVTVRELAFLFSKKSDATTNLSISAFIVLAINPTDLFSISFLLSFSVYLGLILLATPLSRFLSKYLYKTLSKLISSSFIASLVSTPILVDVFGYASIFSFLFNMALIPFISFLYPLIFLSSILLSIFNLQIFAIIPKLSFNAIEFLLKSANVDLFLISGVVFGFSSVLYYLFLYLFANKFNFTRKTYRVLRIITLVIFIVSFVVINRFYY